MSSRTAVENKSLAPADNKAAGEQSAAPEPEAPATVTVKLIHYLDGRRPGDRMKVSAERAAELIAGKYATKA